ncbi:DUF6572 domain-containing protein [Granulicella cerasi]|uniref:DUF6572 domain-containing protein n=1 Tax=Granulicella cerasi TaxID=741063 RepID=A0ABW1ZA80_9BACT|nr:DUF6572 domain-containing protein [Granulicella cerasi]
MSDTSEVTEGTRETVDLVAFDPQGNVILGMVHTEPWGEDAGLDALQERVNVYLAYWDSGQLAADFPESAWKPVMIRLYVTTQPDEEAEEFIGKLEEGLKGHGVGFEFHLLEA